MGGRSAVVDSLFIVNSIVCEGFVFGPCLVGQYLLALLVLQSYADPEGRKGVRTLPP